jgi:hypothetical protein
MRPKRNYRTVKGKVVITGTAFTFSGGGKDNGFALVYLLFLRMRDFFF